MHNTKPGKKTTFIRVNIAATTHESALVNLLTPEERLAALIEAGRKKSTNSAG